APWLEVSRPSTCIYRPPAPFPPKIAESSPSHLVRLPHHPQGQALQYIPTVPTQRAVLVLEGVQPPRPDGVAGRRGPAPARPDLQHQLQHQDGQGHFGVLHARLAGRPRHCIDHVLPALPGLPVSDRGGRRDRRCGRDQRRGISARGVSSSAWGEVVVCREQRTER
ncbi:hypothetical protein CLAIMM_10120, partial [Cladophialophora immunda]